MNRIIPTRCLSVLCSVLALALLAGCGARDPGIQDDGLTISNPHDGIWQDREEPPIRFELEQVFGADEEPEEAILGSVSAPVADDDGNVYFYDGGGKRLVSFDAHGALRWSTGRDGQGPGEFQYLRGVAWDGGDQLYVLNQSGKRLETYGTDGVHRVSTPVDFDSLDFPGLAGFIPPDRFVFQSSMSGKMGTTIVVARHGEAWEEVAKIVEDQSGDAAGIEGLSGGPGVWVVDDQIVVSHVDKYRFAIYDTTGSLRRVIRRDMHNLMRPGIFDNGSMRAIGMFSSLGPFVRLHSGHTLTLASWTTNVSDPDEAIKQIVESNGSFERETAFELDLYDSDDRLLYTLAGEGYAPEIGHPAFVDAEGRLYTTLREPYPQLRRYRVVVDR